MIASPRPADGTQPGHPLVRDAVRMLKGVEWEGTAQSDSGGTEQVVATAPRAEVEGTLREREFVCVERGSGHVRFVGFHPPTGDWPELQVRFEDRGPRRIANLAHRLRARLRRRGVGVAILGPDGAGKSTIIWAVEKQFYFPVESIYMGLYQGQTVTEHRPRRRRPPGLGLAAALLRQQWRWLRGAWHRLAGRLVLFDRYTYDALLPPDRPLSRLGRLRRRVLASACPAPDLVVILDAPAEVLFERKGEHDVATLDRHRRRFLELHRELPASVVLNTSRGSDAAARDLIAAIWREYARRWT